MDYSSLNDQEIKALLMQYDSEMRKLSFQMQVIQATIQKLHENLNTSNSDRQIQLPSELVKDDSKTENNEEILIPKIVSGIEYPKKRIPKFDLNNTKESKKRGPKPKNGETTQSVGFKEYKKRGPKPKDKTDLNNFDLKLPKKRGPKPKNSEPTLSLDVKESKKRGPKPKSKNLDSIHESQKASKGKKRNN